MEIRKEPRTTKDRKKLYPKINSVNVSDLERLSDGALFLAKKLDTTAPHYANEMLAKLLRRRAEAFKRFRLAIPSGYSPPRNTLNEMQWVSDRLFDHAKGGMLDSSEPTEPLKT